MKKIMFAIVLLCSLSTALTSCREEKSKEEKIEEAVNDVGDEIEDVADEVEDAVD